MTIWKIPESTDFFVYPGGELIFHSGETNRSIDLSLPLVQKKLLSSFTKVRTLEKARAWVRTYGCPWGIQSDEYRSPQRVLELAKSLSFLLEFFDLAQDQQTPLIRQYLRKQKRVDRIRSWKTEAEWDAIIERLEDGTERDEDLMHYFLVDFAENNPQDGFITFSALSEYGTELVSVEASVGNDSAYPRSVHVAHVEIESRDMAEADTDERLLQLSFIYLQKALQYLLGALHPTVYLREDSNSAYRLEQALIAETPWHAILSELLRKMTAARAPRNCENENCSRSFVPKRSDQIFCDRPGCRKAASRRRKQVGS